MLIAIRTGTFIWKDMIVSNPRYRAYTIYDPGYNVKSPAATTAKETACNIQEWSNLDENSKSMQKYSKELLTSLAKVFVETVGTSRSIIKRDMYGNHTFCYDRLMH